MPRAGPIALLLALAAAGGCGARRPAPDEPAQSIQLDPIHVKATQDGERVVVDMYDARELFARGSDALRAKGYEEAARLYGAVVTEFPDSELVEPALYNQGLCLDALGRHQEAAASYSALVQRFPDSPDVEDALFRLAGSYEKLESWEDVVRALDALLARQSLSGVERVEALARKGSALIPIGRVEEARAALEEATRLFRQGKGISPSDTVYYYSMAEFKLGEIVHNEMRAIALPPDDANLEAILEEKARLLLEAQRRYTKVIQIGQAHWAAAAAYRIGALYHQLWKDIVGADLPAGLSPEGQEMYRRVLRERARVLLRKAVVQWERTLKLARRLGLDNDWIDSTTRDLEEIRRELAIEEAADDPAAQDAGGG